jgi:uncharacterized protein (TIRG00374 family)
MLGDAGMRTVKALFLILGAALLGVLVYRVGIGSILETLQRLTWWQFALVCLPYTLVMAADTLGWRFAFARDRASFGRLYGARMAGEALNVVTAIGAIGGEAAKAWLVRRQVTYEESVPSVVIAKTTITIAQSMFLLLGLGLAWRTLPAERDILRVMTWLLVIEILAVGGFVSVQVSGLVARGGRLLKTVGVIADTAYAETLDRSLRGYYRSDWRRLALSLGFHLLGWLLGVLDALVILWALGLPVPVSTAIIIEAFGSGVRFATFLVPANLGPSEAANAGAFAVLGFGAAAGLAFSFVRRARQAVWVSMGIVVLIAMRWAAGRRATDAASAA